MSPQSFAASTLIAQRPERPALDITGYVIDAELDTSHASPHRQDAASPSPPPENPDVVTFGFHPALKVTNITDEAGKLLNGERTADGTIRVTPPRAFVQGQPSHWTFEYDGVITGNEDGPVEGLKLAAIQEPISYLLLRRPLVPHDRLLTDRFTAEMHIRVPQGMRVFASGAPGAAHSVTLANGKPGDQYDFNWNKPGFPGTVIAGRFVDPVSAGAGNVKVYVTVSHQTQANQLAQTASQAIRLLHRHLWRASKPAHLNVVELPDDTLPCRLGAGARRASSGSRIGDKSGVRLLANTMAPPVVGLRSQPQNPQRRLDHQRHVPLRRADVRRGRQRQERPAAALEDVAAGALAYDTMPLSSAGRLDPFSPQFQSMTLEKGAMIFHMLRWEIGDKAFLDTLKGALSQYTDKSIRTADFEKVAEAQSQQQLTAFFAQWIDGTGAPQFTNKYAVYRLGNNKGFRTIGEINQDLDLFSMPVELRIETDGKTENQKVDVVGTDSQYVVDTFGRPRRISIDPGDWVLEINSRPPGPHRHPQGPAARRPGRPHRRAGRIPEGPRRQLA